MLTEQRVADLELSLALVQREAANLRKRLNENSRHAWRVTVAHQNAVRLATWRAGGIYPSREYAASHGMSQRQWQNACALLRMARVLVSERRWATRDLPTIVAMLDKQKQYAIDYPEAFISRLNKHARH